LVISVTMEKLPAKHQAANAKMSDARLRQKLEQTGYNSDDIVK